MSYAKGMKIKEYIQIPNSPEILVIKEYRTFNEAEEHYYQQRFEELVEDGWIINGTFDSNTWILSRFYGTTTLVFDIKSHPNINLMLKCYIIAKSIGRGTSATNAHNSLGAVKSFLGKTNVFSKENFIDVRNSIQTRTDTEKQQLYYVKEFLRFCPGLDNCGYNDMLSAVSIPPTSIRSLPSFHSILEFDFILELFTKSATSEQLAHYYPLVLWWKLSTKIPMRPIEFCLLKRKCYSYDQETGKYYIEIERAKGKNGVVLANRFPKLNKLRIPTELYEILEKYGQVADPKEKSRYLLSYQLVSSFFTTAGKASVDRARYDDSIFQPSDLRNLLKNFYQEIIIGQYNMTVIEKEDYPTSHALDRVIEYISPGDTRHMAFSSLIIQGFNVFTIAQIGGHDTLREVLNYSQHIHIYNESATRFMAKNLKNKMKIKIVNLVLRGKPETDSLKKAQMGDEYYTLRAIKIGRCRSKYFPYECIDTDEAACFFCQHSILDHKLINQETIEALAARIDNEIKVKLDLIKTVYSNIRIIPERGIYDKDAQRELSTISKSLRSLINRKAVVEAYKLTIGEENEL